MMFENYEPSFPDQPVVDLYLQIWSKLASFLSKPAFIWSEDDDSSTSTLTYGQLNQSVQSISFNLLLHLQRGDTLLILCPPGLELVQVIFGCQRAGILAVPINFSFDKHNDDYYHLVRAISQTKPKAVIANLDNVKCVEEFVLMGSSNFSTSESKQLSQWLQKLEWIATEDIVGTQGINLQWNSSDSIGYTGCKAEEVYLVQYTSGATGIPKPVLVTAGAAAHNVRTARKAYDLHPNSVIVSWLPQYHDCGLMFLLLTIVSGATCVLTSPSTFIKRPRIWLELISQYKATCTPVPSFTLPLVLKRGGNAHERTSHINLSSMENLIIINEPIYSTAVEEFLRVFKPFGLNPSAISPSYGLAENCTFVSTSWRSGKSGNLPIYKKLLPSAKLDSFEEDIKILVVSEETHNPLEDGMEGEIWISSPSNATGYLGHSSMTRQVFDATLGSWSSGRFVRTGDRGIVIGEERYLYVTGRNSDIIKQPNGKELHPHYIETTAYHTYPQYLRGGCLAAFVVSHDQIVTIVAEMQKNERDVILLRNICEGISKRVFKEDGVRVGEVVLVKCGHVPKTTSGKIPRWLAREKYMRGKMDVLMQIKFQSQDLDLVVSKMVNNGYKGKGGNGETKIRNEEAILMSSANNYTLLLSSL